MPSNFPKTIYVRIDEDGGESCLTAETTINAVVEDEATFIGTYILKESGKFKKVVQRA